MFGNPKFKQIACRKGDSVGTRLRKSTVLVAGMLALLLVAFREPASGQTLAKGDFAFVNVADTTQGFLFFGAMPAINNARAVAFKAFGTGFGTGVFKWDNNTLKTIASSSLSNFQLFGEDLAINPGGVVGFFATVRNSG